MKYKKMRKMLFCGILVASASLRGQELELYIQPDIDSQMIASASLEDPRLGQPAPVMDEARAALGWHYAEFRDTIGTYVQDAKIGKDLLPVNNAILYAGPSTGSPVLGVYRDGTPVEILDTGEWWNLRVETAFPVYFVLDTPPPLPPVTGSAQDSLAEIPEEPATETPSSPPVEERPMADITPVFPSISEPGERTEPVQPDVLGQSYEGTFKKSKRVLGLFAPKSTFYLEGPRRKRIAWVDTGKLVIPGTLKDFLDQEVIIYGERDYVSSSKDWIIRARNMRLK